MTRFYFKAVGAALAASLLIAPQSNAGERSRDLYAYGPAWVGFYIGAHAGLAFTEVDYSINILGIGGSGDDSDTDFIGGLQVGYNWLSGSTLYGIEADRSFLNGHVGTIRGRIGQVMGDKLLYATAGVAFADDDDVDATGFVIGGGVEFDLNHRWRNVTAGVEGLYYHFEDDGSFLFSKYEVDVNELVIRGRINYHLGADMQALK